MRRLAVVAALVVACVMPATADAKIKFGLSTDTPDEFRAVQSQMHVDLDAPFVGFKAAHDFDYFFDRADAAGVSPMITWEPWNPVRRKDTSVTMRAIAKGRYDTYLKRQAKLSKRYRKTVYVRLAHEMNGTWYPWGRSSKDYRAGWIHVVKTFRKAGASNVKFIWSPNTNTFEDDAAFDRHAHRFWPGARYVDIVGSTITRMKVQGSYYALPGWFFKRFDRLRAYGKPMWITESTVNLEDMAAWMPAFHQAVLARPWIEGIVWLDSQTPRNPKFGNTTWRLSEQPVARQFLSF